MSTDTNIWGIHGGRTGVADSLVPKKRSVGCLRNRKLPDALANLRFRRT
jgi:hypothetical protein